ncbi:hypothetical protein CaCOL14_001445 [Colletotrichum acutatum]
MVEITPDSRADQYEGPPRLFHTFLFEHRPWALTQSERPRRLASSLERSTW